MVLCVVLGCFNRSGRKKDASFYIIDDVKEFCERVTSAKEQNRYIYVLMLFYAYTHARRKFEKTSAELHPSPACKG